MKNEDKQLLIRDLCSRLPYGVKIKVNDKIETLYCIDVLDEKIDYGSVLLSNLEDVKPYLFPLSSMTEKQIEEYEDALAYHDYVKGGWTLVKTFEDEYIIPYWFVDFCNKHHLDYRGLIPLGLAIDATNLNIY